MDKGSGNWVFNDGDLGAMLGAFKVIGSQACLQVEGPTARG